MSVFSVRHLTEYRYHRPVAFGEHRLMFRPRDSYDQRLLAARLTTSPAAEQRWLHDVFGNCVTLLRFAGRAKTLVIETEIRLEHTPFAGPDFRTDEAALTYPFDYAAEDRADLGRTIDRHYPDPDGAVARWARQFVAQGRPIATGTLLMTLCYAIRESFTYSRRHEPGTQPPAVTLHLRRGTCRDFALFMMEAVRSLGFAARFVTGYVYVADRDGDATLGGGSTHAWCQVYVPGAGWVEFDPTNGIVGSRDLIRVAVARDPEQAVPLCGSYHGAAEDERGMRVQVNVTTETIEEISETGPED
ncbi:transglutaminase family protein [Roseomonas sp. 18066]|uniref:transglutaminase family protein n=1 Tax=Roseomonas sp. 18066 TaxID=2681412 RepID=UPI0013598B77|nr:transglutaminase family protein [Roseomonas sp. 18066]